MQTLQTLYGRIQSHTGCSAEPPPPAPQGQAPPSGGENEQLSAWPKIERGRPRGQHLPNPPLLLCCRLPGHDSRAQLREPTEGSAHWPRGLSPLPPVLEGGRCEAGQDGAPLASIYGGCGSLRQCGWAGLRLWPSSPHTPTEATRLQQAAQPQPPGPSSYPGKMSPPGAGEGAACGKCSTPRGPSAPLFTAASQTAAHRQKGVCLRSPPCPRGPGHSGRSRGEAEPSPPGQPAERPPAAADGGGWGLAQ